VPWNGRERLVVVVALDLPVELLVVGTAQPADLDPQERIVRGDLREWKLVELE
jgi:hypothetical protein